MKKRSDLPKLPLEGIAWINSSLLQLFPFEHEGIELSFSKKDDRDFFSKKYFAKKIPLSLHSIFLK